MAIKMARSAQQGLGLIELMVAITLGLLLSLAVIQAFLSSRGVFRMQDSVSRLQESGRFAISALTQDIRMAGFMGCPSIDRIDMHIIASGESEYLFGSDTVLIGSNNVTSGNTWGAVVGTDVITIRKASNGSARLAGYTVPGNANIQLANETGIPKFSANDVLMITDCVSADIFRASSVSNTSGSQITIAHASDGNIDNKLSKSYGTDAEVLSFEKIEYFIRDTDRNTPSGKPINALYVRRLTTVEADGDVPPNTAWPAYELIDGVENMQIEYGIDTGGSDRTADAYRRADEISATEWSQVVSVRIDLLLQGTDDNVASGAQAQSGLKFMGAAVSQDGRLRQVFSTTVAIRNRLP